MSTLRYRLDITACGGRHVDHEYFFHQQAALDRRRELRAAGYVVRCIAVLDPMMPGLDAPAVLNVRTATTGQGTLL